MVTLNLSRRASGRCDALKPLDSDCVRLANLEEEKDLPALPLRGTRVDSIKKFWEVDMTNQTEMPLFTRAFDFITWLLPVTNDYPKTHWRTVAKRLLDAALDFREHIEASN